MTQRVFLGTGLIGAALAEGAASRGDEVTAWNRTHSKATPLEAKGIRVCERAEDAVKHGLRVHIALTADEAVDAVLAAISQDIPAGAIIIDHSTTSVAGAIARQAWCAERELLFCHAPVFMSPEACRSAQGVMLLGGPNAIVNAVAEELEGMTGRLWIIGEVPGRAAALKLAGNGALVAMLGGLADAFTMAAQLGLSPAETFGLFENFDPSLALRPRGRRMANGDFHAHWSLKMAHKDVKLMLEAAGGAPLGVLPGLARRMEELVAEGHGDRDIGYLARDAHAKPTGG